MNALFMASQGSPSSPGLELMYKVALVGDEGVGKTSLVLQWKLGEILDEYLPTTETLDYVKGLEVGEDESTILLIWDTPGQDRHLSHAVKKIKEAHIVLIVYDVTSEDSFIRADEFIEIAKESARKDAVVVVVGNKKDLEDERKVAFREGKALATLDDFDFEEVSAKDRDGVTGLLAEAVRKVRARRSDAAEKKVLVMATEMEKERLQEAKVAEEEKKREEKERKKKSRLCNII